MAKKKKPLMTKAKKKRLRNVLIGDTDKVRMHIKFIEGLFKEKKNGKLQSVHS
jgi:hypothetical protein